MTDPQPTERIRYPDSWTELDRQKLDALFEQARREHLWFFHRGLDGPLWFTPDELQANQEKGSFVWGCPNWQLRPPMELLAQLIASRNEASAAVDRHIEKMRQ